MFIFYYACLCERRQALIKIVCCCHGNMHAYQVPLQLASLKSEEVKTWSYLLLFKQYAVVMETMSYTPSFISIGATIKWRSNFKEKCPSLFVVQTIFGCHGNDLICMHTKFNLPLASLRSKAICHYSNNMWLSWKHVVVMEMMWYACVPRFISNHEKWRSNK